MSDFNIKVGYITDPSELKGQYTKAKKEIEQESIKVKISADEKAKQVLEQTSMSIEKLNYRIRAFTRDNPKAVSKMGSEFETLSKKVAQASKSADPKEFKRLNAEFGTMTARAKSVGAVGDTVFSKLGKNVKQFVSYLSSATVAMTAINSFKNMVSAVIAIDTSMVGLKKVTDETNSAYNSFLDTAITKAKQLGASVSDIIDSTADFARLGYSLPDATKLAETATLYKNVGDGIDITQSTESIISTLKAFNIEASDSLSIVDKFNEVGKMYAQVA